MPQTNLQSPRIITTISHEYRTPRTTIQSSAQLLEHYGHKWTQEKKLQHTQRIVSSVKHMTALLNDTLSISQSEAGQLQFSPATINLSQLCHDLVEEMQQFTSGRTIDFLATSACITAELDQKLLRQILGNLLSNALKYSAIGSAVTFHLTCESESVIFRIQDRGIGIPQSEQAQVFDSFQRASNVGTIPGTGLGLAIVKQAVDLHAGQIHFDSEVGVGTTFIVTLPLGESHQTVS